MTDLRRLGDALERAARRDLAPTPPPRARRRRTIAIAALTAAVTLPAAAVAAVELIGEDDVARSLPAGTLSLAGTEPTCTTVRANVEYACELARPPAPEVADWTGTVEPTVDASRHVNGGCRARDAEGLRWRCYIGDAAVRERIIGADFLGEFAPGPGQG